MIPKTFPQLPAMQTIQPKILYFGTPVILITSCNEDSSPNLAPMSSAWALGWTVILGLGTNGKTFENLQQRPECVLNCPSDNLWESIERLAPLTGKYPVPLSKQAQCHYQKDKFGAAGLTPTPSEVVSVPRVAECPIQMEGRVRCIHPIGCQEDEIAAVEVEILRVHAHEKVIQRTNHINPTQWRPLIYNFRHYFGLGKELGKSFRSQT